MGYPGQEDLVEIPEHIRERLAPLRRRRRQPAADLAGLNLSQHGQLADTLEVARRPFERSGAVLAEAHLRNFLISDRREASVREADRWRGSGGTGRLPQSRAKRQAAVICATS